jgi:predicted O-methyltransferase YrrM
VSPQDVEAIKKLSAGKRLVCEIGTFTGTSAEAILSSGVDHLVMVDTFNGDSGGPAVKAIPRLKQIETLLERLQPYEGKFTVIVGRSENVAKTFARGHFDLIFLDAAHDYNSVRRDILSWKDKLVPGGILGGHDFECHAMECDAKIMNERSGLDFDEIDQRHYGVIKAVSESFTKIQRDWTVWSTVIP